MIGKLEQLKTSGDHISQHNCATNDVRTKVNEQLMKVCELWTNTQQELVKVDRFEASDVDTWNEFDQILKTFVEWLTTMREKIYGMEYKLSGSSIEMLKSYYSGILVSLADQLRISYKCIQSFTAPLSVLFVLCLFISHFHK